MIFYDVDEYFLLYFLFFFVQKKTKKNGERSGGSIMIDYISIIHKFTNTQHYNYIYINNRSAANFNAKLW